MKLKEYRNLTKKIKLNSDYILEIKRKDGQYGVNQIRNIGIEGPNPHAGYVVDRGGEQEHSLPDRDQLDGLKFNARSTKQALDLLERTCRGETGLRDTAKEKGFRRHGNCNPIVHGFSKPQGGLDDWIFTNFNLISKFDEGKIKSIMGAYAWETGNIPIHKMKTNNVGEVIDFYNSNPVDLKTLQLIKFGLFKNNQIKNNGDFLGSNSNFKFDSDIYSERNHILSNQLQDDFEHRFEELPFEVSTIVKNGLFIGLLLDAAYTQK